MNENTSENKKNNNVLIIVIVIIALAAIIATFLMFKNNGGNQKNPSTPGDDQPQAPYTFEQKELITFTHKVCEGKLTELSDNEGTIKVKYPIINSKDETVVNLNNLISERVNDYVKNYNLDKKEITEEDIKNYTGECNYVIKSSDNKMESNSYYEYLDYEIMDKEDYMYIVEYFYVRNTSGSIGDDIFNIYNIDKKTGKVVENKEVVNGIKNKEEIKNKIVSFIETNRKTDYDYLNDKEIKEFVNEVKTKMDKNDFKVYSDEDGNTVFVFNELLFFTTYRFVLDKNQQTISIL